MTAHALSLFQPPVAAWFSSVFDAPTRPQRLGWPAIARGDSTLILSPTGSGKTLTAFLSCLDRVMFAPVPERSSRCRVIYLSPLKALAVDVERNLRAPLVGIAHVAAASGVPCHVPTIALRTGDTPSIERARFQRDPADILVTTPESLFLLLTSNARDRLRSVDTIIVDEVHAVVSTKRGAHLALSLERLERIAARPLQRIGLSATQRNLDEIARFLGGTTAGTRPSRARGRAAKPADALAARGGSPASHRDGRGARPARRDDGPCREYVTEEQRRGAGCIARRMQRDFRHGLLGAEFADSRPADPRPVTVIDAREPKPLILTVEVPVADMAVLGTPVEAPSGPAGQAPPVHTIWTGIHPRLLELVRTHRSTLLFVNSRRLAERLAGALNELAGEPLVRAHHGSLAREQRSEIEDRLKAGRLRGLVATSSLELGIDMGAIDLVVQIEAPPSVASALQRVGRSGHRIGEASEGIVFPKFRGDLLACAAVTGAMVRGQVEPSRYPRNPLDVLAQQLVAMTAVDHWDVDQLYATVRGAAPFAELSRSIFEGVLDMLSGRYPSDEFAELRPRVTWDRVNGTVAARQGAKRVAIANAGTIPDRGLYGVFLADGSPGKARVGELDEEMVFEARAGETFVLGASTWRIEQITHDRVLVSPAPGQPGKMPFWRGEGPGRPIELGRAIGALTRELRAAPRADASARLSREHFLNPLAADNLLQYLDDQERAAGAVPDDRTILIERTTDDLGDWRFSVLSPFGGRIHAPWAMAAAAQLRDERGLDAEVMWSDDGFVVRVPAGDRALDTALLIPDPDDVERLVVRQLGATALFAARFREASGRALLLPRRRPGARAPLWQQRKRAADLLAVASKFGSFPIILEAYRECLRDVFDMPALVEILRAIRSRKVRVVNVESRTSSPFAASLLFGYVATYLYDGDAPLAERRAHALAVDQAQLADLIGEGELRTLVDPAALATLEHEVQRLPERYHARSADALHDLVLRLGDLSLAELRDRAQAGVVDDALPALVATRRLIEVRVAGEARFIAVEDAAKYRDALGTPLPPGLPESLLEPAPHAALDLVRCYARTHGPFTSLDVAGRLGVGSAVVDALLRSLVESGRLVEGEFRPGGHGREWCDVEVLRVLRRRSLAAWRQEVEAVEPAVLGRFLVGWHGVTAERHGLDGVLDVVEQLQGGPLLASVLEREVLAARVKDYTPALLDTLIAAGEVVWAGVESVGPRDGRVALFLADHRAALTPPPSSNEALAEREARIVAWLERHGASFFGELHEAAGGGFPQETVDALWTLVWRGLVTNDSLHALRAFTDAPGRTRARSRGRAFRSRRLVPPSAEGRWSSLAGAPRSRSASSTAPATHTTWATHVTRQLLTRHGIVTRECVSLDPVPGGFATLYPVLRRLEDTGRVRRGYFVAGLGGAQFAEAGAIDRLRAERDAPETPVVVTLSSTDPANPYGALVEWPRWMDGSAVRASRTAGARVVLVDGACVAWIARGDRHLLVALPDEPPEQARRVSALARELVRLARVPGTDRPGWLLAEVNGQPAAASPIAAACIAEGFSATGGGLQLRVPRTPGVRHRWDAPEVQTSADA